MATFKSATVLQVQHDMRETVVQLDILAECLEFVRTGGRLLYLVDYTEMSPFWEAAYPLTRDKLSDDRVQRVWDYLTGIERIFLRLDAEDAQLRHIKKAYFDQIELINALLLDDRSDTLITSYHWRLLEDDIRYVSLNAAEGVVNRQAANRELLNVLDQKANPDLTQDQQVRSFIDDSERFAVQAGGGLSALSLRELIVEKFMRHSNFAEVEDFPWKEYKLDSSSITQKVFQELAERGTNIAQVWLSRIEKGNDAYSTAYDLHGRWARRQEGAQIVAFLETINNAVEKVAPQRKLKFVFVTRNRQYHHAYSAARREMDDEDFAKIAKTLHPRLLNALMIDQQDNYASGGERSNAANEALSAASNLRNSLSINLSVVDEISKLVGSKEISRAFGNWVKTSLSRIWETWEESRRQILAIHVQPRIRYRMRNAVGDDKISTFLKGIEHLSLDVARRNFEIQLIKSLPRQVQIVTAKQIPITGVSVDYLLLVKTGGFAHLFMFRSEKIRELIDAAASGQVVDFSKVLKSAQKLDIAITVENDEEEIDRLRRRRFDILILHGICSAATGGLDLAQRYVDAALGVWPSELSSIPDAMSQVREGYYLRGLIDRIQWRNKAHGSPAHWDKENLGRHLKLGIQQVCDLLEESGLKAAQAPGHEFHKRLAVMIVGYLRELYAFAARHSVVEEGWPLSVQECVTLLEEAYQTSVARDFDLTAARARQQYIVLARMYQLRTLPLNSQGEELFSKSKIDSAYDDMISSLKKLLKRCGHLTEADLPATMVISWKIGLWRGKERYNLTRDDVKDAAKVIGERKVSIKEPEFQGYIQSVLDEMLAY